MQDRSGRWLSVRIRPYKGIDNRLDGAVLSVIDIDATKRHQAFVEHSRDYFRAIVDAVDQPLLVLDERGRVRSANRRFYEKYGMTAAETEGRDLSWIAEGRWDPATLIGIVNDASKAGQPVERILERPTPQGPGRTKFTANRLPLSDAHTGILIAIEDLGHGQKPA